MGPGRRSERISPRHRWDQFAAPDEPSAAALLELARADAPAGANAPTGEDGPAGEDEAEGHESGADDGDAQPVQGAPSTRRWAPSWAVAVVVVAALGVCAGLWWWSTLADSRTARPVDSPDALRSTTTRPPAEPGASASSNATASSGASAPTDDGAGQIVVHVAGAVGRPGIVRLPRGSRVHEAIAAAGGPAEGADQNRLNLAAAIEDGSRIVVPRAGEPSEPEDAGGSGPARGTPSAAAGTSKGGTVNLNSATVEDLTTLPRVGPVLAQRIVQYRTQHGRFSSVDGLDAVPGIGPAMLESLRPHLSV
ncbi:helix-hairpin-helix domain-containing protein [Sinomonas sp. JGH33]|uniref:Helix-hairpin-helix domain-containing protein n=1 Tax=Sinomonas terricola TaxID=3110330 RepID=A0ABU5T8C0_9MICC|nr:helix-hairpin-helix domain-containing protein [Sinomonas sp. JGH33]MEA5455331.1 helix-hairpin-helix domain-containing protein [Sinomonas sp. JGH33]